MDNANAASAVSPKPKSSLRVRVISALVLLPIILLIVWWSYWAVAVVVGAVVVISLFELYRSYAHGGYRPIMWVGFTSALLLTASAAALPSDLRAALPSNVSNELLPLTLTLIVVGSLVAGLPRSREEHALSSWALTVAGAVYIGWLFSFIIRLRGITTPLRPGPLVDFGLEPGAAWVYATMAITWLQDTFAYFVGKRWGRTKLAPDLSPKKTWEGAVGGLGGAVGGALLAMPIFCLPINPVQAILLGLVGGVVGPLGDLAESLMKRQVGVKDAGNLIPGHGGLLDRADSLLFTAPVLYYLVLLLVR